MMIPAQVLDETAQRYAAQQPQRTETQAKLSTGKVFQADSPDRVRQRLQRLGLGNSQIQQLIEQATLEAGITDDLSAGIGLERIFQANNLLPIAYLEQGTKVAQSIGRVVIKHRDRTTRGYGTGFLVSPQLLLTNNHVLPDSDTAANSQIEFNYQTAFGGTTQSPTAFDLDPATFFVTDKRLDYSLVAVTSQSASGLALGQFGWLPLIAAQGKIILGEFVNIIQHPNGERKQIAMRENVLIDVLTDFLQYQTDTAPGSSGSPVFNDQWEVVALHHSGVPKRNQQNQILALNGQVWQEQDGDQQIAWLANEGIRISRIIQHLQQQTLSTTAIPLRTQLLESKPPSAIAPDLTMSPIAHPSPPLTQNPPITQPTPLPDGTMQWTIPLQVSVSLGQATMSYPTAPTNPSPIVDDRPQVIAPPPPAAPIGIIVRPTDSELEQFLAAARQAQNQTYYDAGADRTQRDRYYQALIGQVDRLNPSQLYRQLNQLLTQTHQTRPRYQPSRELYPWIDLRPNRKLQSVYSDQIFEPEALIREDFRIEQVLAVRQQELMAQEATMSAAQLVQELSLLEASLPFNCEHVVPQSWFLKKEPMRGDLHHLFTCESRCNSFRGNHPYIDFPDFQEKIVDACGNLSGGEFEPQSGKGVVARATLYFLLRYPDEIDNVASEYRSERLGTLINWHEQFPVDEYEQHRNAAIFAKQGNRNPLIDFPAWASKINFRQGLR
jgi:endonuclease G, mitochondrial